MMGAQTRKLPGFTVSLLTLQWVGNLLALLLAFAWLQIPDSHVWQFVLSVLSGVFIVVAFCWLHVYTFSRIRTEAMDSPLWLRIITFAVIAALWILAEQWISFSSTKFWLYAGYWNSKLSPGQRHVFTPHRITNILQLLGNLAILLFLGLLLPIVIEACSMGPLHLSWKRITPPYRKATYWLAVLFLTVIAYQFTQSLISWMPGISVKAQIASVLVRLGIAYTVDIVLWCLLLSLTASKMERGPHAAPEEPEVVRQ